MSELGWLLWNLERPEAKELWCQLKSTLFEKVSPDNPRSLIRCIGRFKDRAEVPRLRQWLNCVEDFAQPAAFSVLCQLDPDAALVAVEDLADANAAFARSWWVPELFFRMPQEANERLLAVAKRRDSGHHYLADIYAGQENLIDSATLEFYLDALEAELVKCSDQVVVNNVPRLDHRLGLVANIHRPDLLRVIEAKANTPLEKLLLEIAQSLLPRLGFSKDPVFNTAHAVLCKIGGEGVTELINSELASNNHLTRRRGMADALKEPDDRTRALLRLISQSHELEGNPPRPVEQGRALQALAALGDDQAVIRGILRWGQHVPRSILLYRTPQKPVEIVGLREVLDLLIRNNAAKADSALMAASVSRNCKYIPPIQEILKQAPPESHTALCAAIALMALDDKSEEFFEILIRLLAT